MQPRMKEIARMTLGCAVDMIEHRKNSWELYGFDFMVDDEFNTWLIEVNSSPACDYSTPTTERYVQKALVELLSVTLDMRKWEATPKKDRGDKPDTGGWECIYKGPMLETPAASFGTDMSVKGAGVRAPRRAAPPAANQISPLTMGLQTNNFGDHDNGSAPQKSHKGQAKELLISSRRQSSGVENSPAPPRAHRDSGNGSDDGDADSVEIGEYDEKPINGVKTIKAAYDPSSIARTAVGNGEVREKVSVKNIQAAVIKSAATDVSFDDSSGDEGEGGRDSIDKQGGFGAGKKQKNSGSSKRITSDNHIGVAVPLKVFSVDF